MGERQSRNQNNGGRAKISHVLRPDELHGSAKHPEATGNKAAFLRAVCGTMTEAEAAHLLELIDEGCERIDEYKSSP